MSPINEEVMEGYDRRLKMKSLKKLKVRDQVQVSYRERVEYMFPIDQQYSLIRGITKSFSEIFDPAKVRK